MKRMARLLQMHAALALSLVCTIAMAANQAPQAVAIEPPTKEIVSAFIGRGVDKTTEGPICTIESGHECGSASPGAAAGNFQFAGSVAVAPTKDIYVADEANSRIQELKPDGEFVLMFGAKVNKKGGNICTKAGEGECQAGERGSAAGEFSGPQDVAVDQSSGNVYVLDLVNWRIDEFTAGGEFVLMFGAKVNKKGGNICTKAEEGECQAGMKSPLGGTEPGAFNFASGPVGNLIAVGPGGVVYVGDEHRVQEFNSNGEPVGEIRAPLEQISSAAEDKVLTLAVDTTGDVFLVYRTGFLTNTVREFDPSGKEIGMFGIVPQEPEGTAVEVEVRQIALDALGHLAVAERESYYLGTTRFDQARGTLYEVGSAGMRTISQFRDGFPNEQGTLAGGVGMAFDGVGLYEVGQNEVVVLHSVPIAEVAEGKALCKLGAPSGTDVTLECHLEAEVNPFEVPETEAWFEWGKTRRLGTTTSSQVLCTSSCGNAPLGASATLTDLQPHATYYYRPTARDRNVRPPEDPIFGPTATFATETVAPRTAGELSASFVRSTAAVMSGRINPENTKTQYRFQYAPAGACEKLEGELAHGITVAECPGMMETTPRESSTYGEIVASGEASGLQPATAYRYRLYGVNQKGQAAENENGENQLPEGTFATMASPTLRAATGGTGGVSTTEATVTGTIDSRGEAVTYGFEVGVYAGPVTQFGLVFSGSVPAAASPVEEVLRLTGLQPGTTYAYRIKVSSGLETVYGAAQTFATLPIEMEPARHTPELLPTPLIGFPEAARGKLLKKCHRGYKRGKKGRCVKAVRRRARHHGHKSNEHHGIHK